MFPKRVGPVRPGPTTDGRPHNRLLAQLPRDEFDRLLPHLNTVPIRLKQVLQKEGETLRHVYFPNGGVHSITTVLSDGRMVEVATVGTEGIAGIEAFFNDHVVAPAQAMVQMQDTSVVMLGVEAFRAELACRAAFHEIIGRYAQHMLVQSMQSTACNALHDVQQRSV